MFGGLHKNDYLCNRDAIADRTTALRRNCKSRHS